MALAGDSIGDASRLYLADQGQRQAGLQNALQDIQQMRRQRVSNDQWARQYAFQVGAQASNDAYQKAHMKLAQDEAQRNALQQAVENAYKDKYFNQILLPQIQMQKQQMDLGMSPAQERSNQNEFSDAYNEATMGELGDHPTLHEEQRSYLGKVNDQALKLKGQKEQGERDAADIENDLMDTDRQIQEILRSNNGQPPTGVLGSLWWKKTNPEADNFKALQDRKRSLQAALEPIKKEIGGQVRFDRGLGTFGQWVPRTASGYTWNPMRGAATGTAGPAANPVQARPGLASAVAGTQTATAPSGPQPAVLPNGQRIPEGSILRDKRTGQPAFKVVNGLLMPVTAGVAQ